MLRGEEQVLRLEVAVDDAEVVTVLHRVEQDAAQVARFFFVIERLRDAKRKGARGGGGRARVYSKCYLKLATMHSINRLQYESMGGKGSVMTSQNSGRDSGAPSEKKEGKDYIFSSNEL